MQTNKHAKLYSNEVMVDSGFAIFLPPGGPNAKYNSKRDTVPEETDRQTDRTYHEFNVL